MKTLFLFLAFSTQALAWGPVGHQVVGEIAQRHLTPKAKLLIARLIPNQTLADVSNWADVIKGQSEWSHTKPWHFVDIADGETYDTAEHSHEGDAIGAITDMVKTLKASNTDLVSKQNSLKFLVHFVGDLHQPLHVGRPEDRGGNDVRVILNGKTMNLHAVWDSGILATQGMDYMAYAARLDSQKAVYDLPEIVFSQIISENMGYRPDIYRFRVLIDNVPVVLDPAYVQRNLSIMNNRLLTGGKRLAEMLNKIFI